jgi:type I restriction enzyme, S subunit
MAVNEGYKQTVVGLIPKDWGYDVFKEITEVLKCGIASTPKYVQNGIPFISAQNIKDNKLVLDKFQRIAKEYHIELTKNVKPRKGDILLTRVGAGFGETALVDVDLDFSIYVSLTLIRMKKNYHPLYYVYLLNSNQYRAIARKSIFQGGGVPNLNVKVVEKYAVLVPPFPEQQAISTALSDIDGLVDSLSKLIEKKTKIKQGAMQELLTGKKRLEGFSGAWVENKLGNIGNCFAGGTPSTFNYNYWGGEIIWLPSGRVQNNKIIKNNNEITITKKGLDESSAKLIRRNSVLIAITGATCGNIALLEFEASANQSVVAIETNNEFDFIFVYYVLLTKRGVILSGRGGSAQGGVNLSTVKNISIMLPEKEEQTAIATILSDMDSEIEKLQLKLDKYKAIKQGMMQELLTGRIRLLEGA